MKLRRVKREECGKFVSTTLAELKTGDRFKLYDDPVDRDYTCGAAFCDDPACNTHGPKNADGDLVFWASGGPQEDGSTIYTALKDAEPVDVSSDNSAVLAVAAVGVENFVVEVVWGS